jgi:hypothetical protein
VNVFIERIEAGKIKTLAQLKSCYRALAKSIHPDTAIIDDSGGMFVKLQGDFEEARKRILGMGIGRAADDDEDYRALFHELTASGFPVDARAKTTKAYRDRLDRFRRAVDRRGIEGASSFSAVEAELERMRGEGIVQNPLFGNVRLLFYQIVSHYCNPTMFTLGAIRKIYGEIEADLRARGFASLDAFLAWMIGDLGRGDSRRARA